MTTIQGGPSIPLDLRLLAESVLSGDESAAGPLIDCWLENTKGGGERLSVGYVQMLEDLLLGVRTLLRKATERNSDPYSYDGIVYQSESDTFYSNYFKCEQIAKSLGRGGLS